MSTRSIFNTLMNSASGIEPEVGMGVTILFFSDRHAGTITEIEYFKSGQKAGQPKTITVQEDKAIRTDSLGMSDAQSYRYERNPDGMVRVFKANKRTGKFEGLLIGHRKHYYDFSF